MGEIGIDPFKLAWKPMPLLDNSETFETLEPDTTAEDAVARAKEVLAKVFHVAPSAIEITIRV